MWLLIFIAKKTAINWDYFSLWDVLAYEDLYV